MILRQLTDKPWEPVPGGIDDRYRDGIASLPAATIGLRMFLAVVTVLFFLLIISYGSRMAFAETRLRPESWLLWLNTAILVLSSVSMQSALIAARREKISGVKIGLLAGGIFAFAFLAGQLVAWQQLRTMDEYSLADPSIGFFYLITALHALHLAGGIVAWVRTTLKTRGDCNMAQIRLSVQLCATYWHYLLLVWLVLFGLLFSDGEKLSWGFHTLH